MGAPLIGGGARPEEEPLLDKGDKSAVAKAGGLGIANEIVYGLINAVVRSQLSQLHLPCSSNIMS